MIGKQFFRDGYNLMNTTGNYRIALGDVQWRKLKVSDDKQDIVGCHGTLTGPTYTRGRTIIIEGLIIASTSHESNTSTTNRAVNINGNINVGSAFDLNQQMDYWKWKI